MVLRTLPSGCGNTGRPEWWMLTASTDKLLPVMGWLEGGKEGVARCWEMWTRLPLATTATTTHFDSGTLTPALTFAYHFRDFAILSLAFGWLTGWLERTVTHRTVPYCTDGDISLDNYTR